MRQRVCITAGLVLMALLTGRTAAAAVIFADLGTSAPPATLGSYAMVPFEDDLRAPFSDVATVPAPAGGEVAFDIPLEHREIPDGWATWSHAYSGDVYVVNDLGTRQEFFYAVELTLPGDIVAFYLYAEPGAQDASYEVTAVDQDGTSYTRSVAGAAGAHGFGFYTTNGSRMTSLLIGSNVLFAIGEFALSRSQTVPEPATGALLAVGLAWAARVRRARARTNSTDASPRA